MAGAVLSQCSLPGECVEDITKTHVPSGLARTGQTKSKLVVYREIVLPESLDCVHLAFLRTSPTKIHGQMPAWELKTAKFGPKKNIITRAANQLPPPFSPFNRRISRAIDVSKAEGPRMIFSSTMLMAPHSSRATAMRSGMKRATPLMAASILAGDLPSARDMETSRHLETWSCGELCETKQSRTSGVTDCSTCDEPKVGTTGQTIAENRCT